MICWGNLVEPLLPINKHVPPTSKVVYPMLAPEEESRLPLLDRIRQYPYQLHVVVTHKRLVFINELLHYKCQLEGSIYLISHPFYKPRNCLKNLSCVSHQLNQCHDERV
ncbi:hypothetical protein ACLOJK_038300 [Asimina triloba]